jgi:hypothetical protein
MENVEFNVELSDAIRALMPKQSTAVRMGNNDCVYVGSEYKNFYGLHLIVEHIFDEGCYCRVVGTEEIKLICPSVLGQHKAVGNAILSNAILDNKYLLESIYGDSHE